MDVCLKNLLSLIFFFFFDILKKQFGQKTVFLVEKELTKELFVMKMINIGQENSEERKNVQKEIAAEINIGLTLGRECPFLVRYLEMLSYENFCCLIMEYCELENLQQELDSGKQYEEPLSHTYFYIFMFFFFFLGDKKVVSSCWMWTFETSLS
jgi:serine/threonine protein kinase